LSASGTQSKAYPGIQQKVGLFRPVPRPNKNVFDGASVLTCREDSAR